MIQGRCLCNSIQYEYTGEITEVSMCHCGQCRLAQGGTNAPVCPIDVDKFTLIHGQDLIKEYESSPGKYRAFCSCCGSPIYSRRADKPTVIRLRLGTVITDFTCDRVYHKFVAHKASWDTIADGNPQYPDNV